MAGKSVVAIDPGRDKFGIAVVDEGGVCRWRSVERTEQLLEVVEGLCRQYPNAVIVLGDGTGSDDFRERIVGRGLPAPGREPIIVDERHSTEEARRLYLLEHRRGWRRFIPLGLQVPDVPVDGYVAEVLARRYIESAAEGPVGG